MGLRFRKRIKLFPGLWLNVSKSGVSTSIGGKGLTVNLKGGKVKTTASIPGTGLSYSQTTGHHDNSAHQASIGEAAPASATIPAWVWLLVIIVAVVLWLLM
jgi:hypothetical protein